MFAGDEQLHLVAVEAVELEQPSTRSPGNDPAAVQVEEGGCDLSNPCGLGAGDGERSRPKSFEQARLRPVMS